MAPMRDRADSRSVPTSIAELRRVGQPPEVISRRSAEHWLSHVYARRVSPYVSMATLKLGISANALTTFMIVVGMAAAALLAIPGAWSALASALMLQAFLVLDCADGEVARWNNQAGPTGVYLDRLGHYLVDGLLFIMVGVRTSDALSEWRWLVIGLVTSILVLLTKVESDLVDVARARSGMLASSDQPAELTGLVHRARGLVDIIPIHRILGAVEASFLIAIAAIADLITGGLLATRVVAIVLLTVALLVVITHPLSILASDRLTRE